MIAGQSAIPDRPGEDLEADHDFTFLCNTPGIDIKCKGDTSEYVTTGKGTVIDSKTCKEYPLIEKIVERQSGRDIFMAYVDFDVSLEPVLKSERVQMVTSKPQQKKIDPRICKGIEDGTLLPTRQQLFDALSVFNGGKAPESLLDFCFEHGLFEILTKEYIEALATYLEERIRTLHSQIGRDVTILEVGAGDGRLTHFLRQELERRGVQGYRIFATDSGNWRIPPQYPVEKEDAQTAIGDYEPQIVLSCWMPRSEDWTGYMRKAPSVQEYLLIGPKDSGTSGDATETWGQEIKDDSRPIYEQQGFERQDIDHLSAMQMGQKDRGPFRYSFTVSFQRLPKSEQATLENKEISQNSDY